MRVRRCATIVALPVAAVMLVAGCSSSGGSSGSGGSSNANGAITIDGIQPQNPLIPSNTNEDGGHRVVEAVFSHLGAWVSNHGLSVCRAGDGRGCWENCVHGIGDGPGAAVCD